MNTPETIHSLLPYEYQCLLSKLTDEDISDLMQTYYRSADQAEHSYILLLSLIEQVITISDKPNDVWFFIYGRIAFIGSKYDELLEFTKQHPNNIYLKPFLARIYMYQGDLETAGALVKESEDFILGIETHDMFSILLNCDIKFSKGLVSYYSRDLEGLENTVNELSTFINHWKIKKIMTAEYQPTFIFNEYVLRMLIAFAKSEGVYLADTVKMAEQIIGKVVDPWLKGYFYNLAGISAIQGQDIKTGEERMHSAMELLEICHDIRTYSVVGANLGVLLILEGRRDDGRDIIEEVLKPLVELGNYTLAQTYMLLISKHHFDTGHKERALKYLNWAEDLTTYFKNTEPATYAYFVYMYSKLGNLIKAKQNLNILEELTTKQESEKSDTYAIVWFSTASATYNAAIGNLATAEEIIRKGISIADENALYDSSLELTIHLIDILLREFIINGNHENLMAALNTLTDLDPLIQTIENRYFNTIIYLIKGYIYATLNLLPQMVDTFVQAKENSADITSDQNIELQIFEERINTLYKRIGDTNEITIVQKWLQGDLLKNYLIQEALRLLIDLQFQQVALGDKPQVVQKLPAMLMIVQNSGIVLYSHKFSEDIESDEVLISALLMAVSSFSKEVFGSGNLKRIEAGDNILLLNKLDEENVIVLVVKEESYSIRKKFKDVTTELQLMNIGEYLSTTMFSDDDQAIKIIEEVVIRSFVSEEEETN